MNESEAFRISIERGDIEAMRSLLSRNPVLANTKIQWYLNQANQSDPLHYVSGAVFNGWLTTGAEAEMAQLLLEYGAELEGSEGAESPLIGAVSLSVPRVADVLLDAGADVHRTSVHGAQALHWAAWVGQPPIVQRLLQKGSRLEYRCQEFQATPLFWAVQAFSRFGSEKKRDHLGAAKVLLEAGASIYAENCQGVTALERAKESDSMAMYELLNFAYSQNREKPLQ